MFINKWLLKYYSFLTNIKKAWSILMTNTTPLLDENGEVIEIRPSTRKKGYGSPEIDMWIRLKNPLGTIFLPEILKAVSAQPIHDDKIKMIRMWWQREPKNAELMRTFMLALYHPGVKFAFPDSKPPFMYSDANDLGMTANTLYKAVRKLKLLSDGPDKIQNSIKRENTLIQQLETLHKLEADLYLMIIFKKIDETVYPGINEDFLRQAFSAVLPPKKV